MTRTFEIADESMKPTAIFVGAHPDDVEWACGGTVALYVQRGYDVVIIFATRGENGDGGGHDWNVRARESLNACKVLGVDKSKVVFGKFQDTLVPDSIDPIRWFLEKIYSEAGDVREVFVPSVRDTHQDHGGLAKACLSAFRRAPRILAYESPSAKTEFSPTMFVDITRTIRTKLKALRCHTTQIDLRRPYMEPHAIKSVGGFRGGQIGVRYAEAFEPFRWLFGPNLT